MPFGFYLYSRRRAYLSIIHAKYKTRSFALAHSAVRENSNYEIR